MLYQYVDEAVDTLKSRVYKVQERKLFLLEKQIEKLQQQMEYLFEAESSLQTSLQELEAISFLGVSFLVDILHRTCVKRKAG